jgi:hypothetical protein
MVDTGRSAQSQAGAAGQESQIKSKHVIAGPPLDFSFLKISNVNVLKSTPARGGLRREIVADEDDEESKKNDVNT